MTDTYHRGSFLIGYIEDGERMVDAIARVACLAGQNGYTGYAIHCRTCNEPFGDGPTCYCTRKEQQIAMNEEAKYRMGQKS